MFSRTARSLLQPVTRGTFSQLRQTSIRFSRSFASQSTNDEKVTHFGFRDVKEEDKEELVGEVFHSVADQYDIMNDFMSGTLHRFWKDEFVDMVQPLVVPGYNMRVIDVAGGTGDISFRMFESSRKQLETLQGTPQMANTEGNPFSVAVCDINPSMLEVGKKRAIEKGFPSIPGGPISWKVANAEELPFEDNSFDLYTIAFGIRNCTHVDTVVAEAYRVLKPGGRFMVLEFSHLAHPLLQQAYDLYSFNVIPAMGEMITNDRDSYQYLVESIRKFPKQREFEQLIRSQGFGFVRHTNMTFGVVAVHTGVKMIE